MKKGMKITKDGFIWKTILRIQATEIWDKSLFELYVLHSDDSETLIENEEQFLDALENDLLIGIEVGKIDIEQAKEIITNSGRGVITYSIADFEGRAKDIVGDNEDNEYAPEFDETKFPLALEKMINSHDMCNGITWDTIDFYLEEYCTK
jgi:hypothetical protein